MRDYRLRKVALSCLVLACALGSLSPAQAAETQVASGTVKFAWFGPSGETINDTGGQQLIGASFAVQSGWTGKHFRLAYPGSGDQPIVDVSGYRAYAVDLDVYFHSSVGWMQEDGTIRNWDNETGVKPGPESGTIPLTTDHAFVTISELSPNATDVDFQFFVTLA